jgi:hypothetical protein
MWSYTGGLESSKYKDLNGSAISNNRSYCRSDSFGHQPKQKGRLQELEGA